MFLLDCYCKDLFKIQSNLAYKRSSLTRAKTILSQNLASLTYGNFRGISLVNILNVKKFFFSSEKSILRKKHHLRHFPLGMPVSCNSQECSNGTTP